MSYIFKIFILCLSITLCLTLNLKSEDFHAYDKCDPKWANEPLWVDEIEHKTLTICKGDTRGNAFDGPLITLLSSYLAIKKIKCKDFDSDFCTPKSLNFLILDFLKQKKSEDELWSYLKLGQYVNTVQVDNISKFLKLGFTLFFTVNTDREFRMAISADENKVYGFASDSTNVEVELNNVTGYYGWLPPK
jgi:hypothetical protein